MSVYVDQSYLSCVTKSIPCVVPGSLTVISELYRRKTTEEKMLLTVIIDTKATYSKPLKAQDPQSYFQGSASTQRTYVVSVLKNCSPRLALAEVHRW